MKTGNYNITKLTEAAYNAMKGISKNIFLRRPKSHNEMKDFVVVSFPNRVYDNIGSGNTNCVIELYARDTATGEPNMPKLSSMQEKVYERLPVNDDICTVYRPTPVFTGPDGLGFHSIFIYCKVTIK